MQLRLLMCVLALLAATGCSSSSESSSTERTKGGEPTPAPEPTPAAQPAESPARVLMHDHFEKAYGAREHLIRADLEAAKGALKWLAEHQRGDALDPSLRPLLDDMQRAAALAQNATSLRDAGDALAGTFARCGVCHEKAGKGPSIAETPKPEGTDGVSHMKLHHWATQQMFEGLVTSSTERFNVGAEALRSAVITPEALGTGDIPAADVARLDAHIHKLATEAQDLSALRARAELYGRVLATCATCHKLMKRGPQPLATADLPVP